MSLWEQKESRFRQKFSGKPFLVYHTSKAFFLEFDLNLADPYGDGLIFTGKKGIYFAEKPIPYYPNRYIYKCLVWVSDEDIVRYANDFTGISKHLYEVIITHPSRMRILEIYEVPDEVQQKYLQVFNEYRQSHPDAWWRLAKKLLKKMPKLTL